MIPDRSRRRTLLLVSAILFLLNAWIYTQALAFGFVSLDDDVYVTRNAMVRSGLTSRGVVWAFTTSHAANWHPLTWLSLMLDSSVGGVRPGVYHATNVLLHALSSVLLFSALSRMTRGIWRSAFVAAVFAVHPLHVESVAWISSRKDSLSALFGFLALLAYPLGERSPRVLRLVPTALLFALGLMAKPTLVTLPLLLLLLDFWPLKRTRWLPLLREKAPLFLLALGAAFLTWRAQSSGGALDVLPELSLGARLSNAILTPVSYLTRTVWPAELAVFYPHPGEALSAAWVTLAAALLGALTLLALRAARRFPYLTVGWLWYLVALLPTLGIVQAGRQAMADRYTYLPLIGLALALAWGAADFLGSTKARRPALGAAAALCVGALGVAARAQASVWRDTRTLFEHALRVTRGSPLAEAALGSELVRTGEPEAGLEHLREAVRIDPGFVEGRDGLARALLRLGRTDEAILEWNEVLRRKPDYEEARAGLAAARLAQGRTEEAVAESMRALRGAPDLPPARTTLGLVLLRRGRFEEAAIEFRRALAADPDHAAAHAYLAGILLQNGDVAGAKAHCRAALEVDPAAPGAHYNLGLALLREGDLEGARAEFEAAIVAEPRYADSRLNLGVVLARLGRLDDAEAQFEEALRIDPSNRAARNNLEMTRAQRR